MQMGVPAGQVNYEPSSLGPDIARASAESGYRTFPNPEAGEQLRVRPESFADHYSQARMFFASQTEPEQNHIVSALVFELSKCITPRVRTAMLSRLINIDETLAARVAAGLGAKDPIVPAPAPVSAIDMAPSPALSILAKAEPTLMGRKIGCLVSDGSDGELVKELQAQAEAAGAKVQIIGPTVGGVLTAQGDLLAVDHKVDGGPVDTLRRGRGRAVRGRRRSAGPAGGGRQLRAGRLRPPQGDRLPRFGRADAGQGRRRRQSGQ